MLGEYGTGWAISSAPDMYLFIGNKVSKVSLTTGIHHVKARPASQRSACLSLSSARIKGSATLPRQCLMQPRVALTPESLVSTSQVLGLQEYTSMPSKRPGLHTASGSISEVSATVLFHETDQGDKTLSEGIWLRG